MSRKAILYEHKKELWKGQFVSVRSDWIEKALKELKPLMIKWHDQFMLVEMDELRKGIASPKTFKSKITGESYSLIDFMWKPNWSKPELKLL